MTLTSILAREPCIVTVLPGEGFAIPNIDYNRYGSDAEKANASVNAIIDVLSMPYILDAFTNHNDRRAWRSSVLERHPHIDHEELQRDALSAGNWGPIFMHLRLIGRYEQRTQTPNATYIASTEGIVRNVSMFTPCTGDAYITPYDRMAAMEKYDFVKGLKIRVHNALLQLERAQGQE